MAVLLGVALASPSLGAGLIMDDFWHWEAFTVGRPVSQRGSVFGLFSLMDGDPIRNQNMLESGNLPWWSALTLRIAFWRPFTELSHWLDYQLWPSSPALMHLQSLAWYALLVALLGKLYYAIDSQRPRAGLSVLLFATCGLHGLPVGWIANRNSVIASCFITGCLIGYDSWRRQRRGSSLVLAVSSLLLGLLSAEIAISALPYLLAYAFTLEPRARGVRRLSPLLPFVLVVLLWKATSIQLGYGSTASGQYIDPASDPIGFARLAAIRVPLLLLSQLLGVAAGPFNVSSHQAIHWGLATLCVVAIGWSTVQLGLWRTPVTRFYGLGMLLALLPVSAAVPDDRLLIAANIGASGMIASFLLQAFAVFRQPGTSGLIKGTAVAMSVAHFLWLPLYMPLSIHATERIGSYFAVEPALDISVADHSPNTRVLVVNPPLTAFGSYTLNIRRWYGLATPNSIISLAPGTRKIVLHVLGDRSLKLRVDEGFITPGDTLYRSPNLPFRVGDIVDLGTLQVTVSAVLPDGRPSEVLLTFASSVYSDDWKFYGWRDAAYEVLQLPPPGASLEFAPCDAGQEIQRSLLSG